MCSNPPGKKFRSNTMISQRYISFLLSGLLLGSGAFSFSVSAATSAKCPGEQGYIFTNDRNSRNPRAGGFVSNSAFVDDSVFIAPTAAVCGSASVLRYARVYGKAVVGGEAEVTDKARVYGNARVYGTAYIGGEAKVSDHARVFGEAIVEGRAWIRGYAKLSSGHYTEGTKKPAQSQASIDAERRKAKAKADKAAKEKCLRDWETTRKSLEDNHRKAVRAANAKGCNDKGLTALDMLERDCDAKQMIAYVDLMNHKKRSAAQACN